MRSTSSKQPKTSKGAFYLKDINPTKNPSGGEKPKTSNKPKTSDIPIVKNADASSSS